MYEMWHKLLAFIATKVLNLWEGGEPVDWRDVHWLAMHRMKNKKEEK